MTRVTDRLPVEGEFLYSLAIDETAGDDFGFDTEESGESPLLDNVPLR